MFKCCSFNARSVANKLIDLHHLMYSETFACILITESWLHPHIYDGVIDPNRKFKIFRKDRVNAKGGGVLVLVRRCYSVERLSFNSKFNILEIVGIRLLDFKPNVTVFAVYRPPSYTAEALTYMTLLIDCLGHYMSDNCLHIIVGDVNLPRINWNALSCPNDILHHLFLDFIVTNSFSQFVTFATRGDNILDVLCADVEQIISSISCLPPIGTSDHAAVAFMLVLACCSNIFDTESNIGCRRYLWHKANFDFISEYLSAVHWPSVFHQYPSAELSWNAFTALLHHAVELFVPQVNYSSDHSRNTANSKRCRSRDIRLCANTKRKLWKRLRKQPCDSLLHSKYRDCVHKWRVLLEKSQTAFEDRLIVDNDLGAFYRYINKRITNNSSFGVIIDSNGDVISDKHSIANAFNQYFAHVGTVDDNVTPVCNDILLTRTLESVTVYGSDVSSSISRLKGNCSCGPDGFPPILFKRLKHCISEPLAFIYNQLLSVGYVPTEWLSAYIVPVHKKGATGDPANYRPISLTCVASKILERIIVNRIFNHLSLNNILHPAQHGFVKARSTLTNLMESFNDWTILVQSKQQITIVYIDFSKAFDVVCHRRLFLRLKSYGICGTLLLWLQSFFSGRTHQTKVDSSLSDVAELISGVVQGSGIGPLMFVIYINELIEILERYNIKVKLFADDVKMYVHIIDDIDVHRLQLALDALVDWSNLWQLSISVNKCCVLNVGKVTCNTNLSICGTVLPSVESTRDLGVIVSHDLSPSEHVNTVAAKAHQRANAILRAFSSRDRDLLMRAFIVYVRPMVEHNCSVWSPSLASNIDALESVQRRFTKRLCGLKNVPYTERLVRLRVPSLQVRRIYADLILCYKIVFGLVGVCCEDFFVLNDSCTRGHRYKLYKRQTTACVRSNFFCERIVNIWNGLPDTVDFGSLPRFKRSIRHISFDKFVRYC